MAMLDAGSSLMHLHVLAPRNISTPLRHAVYKRTHRSRRLLLTNQPHGPCAHQAATYGFTDRTVAG